MKKRYRIKKNSEIDAIFSQKRVKGNAYFLIYRVENVSNSSFRFALSIGKRYGNAVERNRAKRRIRMIISEVKDSLKPRASFVVVIKPESKALTYQEMRRYLLALLKKSRIMENGHV
ncbi:MAG: ribonuclease P protein component [Acholeplasmataceae bacterium]